MRHGSSAHKATIQTSTRQTPHRMVSGRDIRLLSDFRLQLGCPAGLAIHAVPAMQHSQLVCPCQVVFEFGAVEAGSLLRPPTIKQLVRTWGLRLSHGSHFAARCAWSWIEPYSINQPLTYITYRLYSVSDRSWSTAVHFNRFMPTSQQPGRTMDSGLRIEWSV